MLKRDEEKAKIEQIVGQYVPISCVRHIIIRKAFISKNYTITFVTDYKCGLSAQDLSSLINELAKLGYIITITGHRRSVVLTLHKNKQNY